MQTAGGGFAAALDADQTVDYKVTITFPAGVQASYSDVTKSVASIDVQRSVTTSLPDGTSLINGYATAQASVVLSGYLNQNPGVALVEAQSIYWLMNPNDSTSPMYRSTRAGLPIVIQAGLWDGASSADLVTIFTGTIDMVECSEGVVSLTCRDQRSTITNQAMLPPVITSAPYNAGLTSEYAVDYLLRHSSPSSYLSWPAQRANCVLAVSFRTSLWPEVGSYSTFAQPPEFAPGVFGTALTSNATSTVSQYALAAPIPTASSFFAEAWITCIAGEPSFFFQWLNATSTYGVQAITGTGNVINVATDSPGGSTGSHNVTLPAGSHYVSVKGSWPAGSSTCSVTVTVDSTVSTFTTSAVDTRDTSPFTLFKTAAGQGTIEALQVTSESAPASNAGFSPTLVFDANGSLNTLAALPDVSGQDTWSALQDIAAGENAMIYFDELGVCHFINRQTIDNAAVSRTVTSTSSLINLDSLEQMSLCATHVQVPVNQIQVQPASVVWQSSTALSVIPGTPLVFTANTQDPVVNVATTDSGQFNEATWVLGNTYWMANTLPDGTGAIVTSGISVTVSQQSSSQLKVTVVNSAGVLVYLVSGVSNPGIGTPLIIIGGQFVTAFGSSIINSGTIVAPTIGSVTADAQWPPVSTTLAGVTSGGASTNTQFGDVSLTLSSNNWIQQLTAAQTFADDLLADLFYPKPLFRNLQIVADPRLQLLDRVTVVDTDVSQTNTDALIIGIDISLSGGAWSQTIDGRQLIRPGAWVLGVVGSSELNLTTWIY